MDDHYELERFVIAQDRDGSYDAAVRELLAGRKASHWRWWIFPQSHGARLEPVGPSVRDHIPR